MTRSALARLRWLSEKDGGRTRLPAARFVSPVRFESQRSRWPRDAFSLVMEFTSQPDAERSHVVTVHFLVEAAPHELLSAGQEFDVLEGDRLVATGLVLGSAGADQ
jgi:hypothetical protein